MMVFVGPRVCVFCLVPQILQVSWNVSTWGSSQKVESEPKTLSQRPKYPCWGPNGTKRAAKRPTSCCCVPCVASPRASQALRSFSRGIAWERVETGRIQGRIKWIKVLRYVLVEIYTWHTLCSLLTILIGLLPSNEISTIMAPTSKHVQQPCRHQPGHCQLLGERCQHCRHCRCSRSLRCLCSATTSNEQ